MTWAALKTKEAAVIFVFLLNELTFNLTRKTV